VVGFPYVDIDDDYIPDVPTIVAKEVEKVLEKTKSVE
jgi:hypothetical protein